MKDDKATTFGATFLELLFLLFLGLKLSDKIDWSWWWVFAPIWGPLALICVLGGVLLLIAAIEKIIAKKK